MSVSLASLVNALKPKQRTDQYLVLASLYSLGGERQAFTAAEIKEALKIHLGTKVPANVPATLRKAKAYVEPSGPPLRWTLTEDGIEKLGTMSELPLAVASPPKPEFDYDIGIVCALEQPEFDAVRNALGGAACWKEIGDGSYAHVYREAILKTDAGKTLRVVATASTSMGLTAAAIATTQLILQFRPKIVTMIGIAAGTRSGGKQFGDVLVADPSVDYNSGKVVEANGIREFQPDPYPIGINPRLRTVLKRYASDENVFKGIRSRWVGKVPTGANRLHVGPLGAADQVIDDPNRVLEITKNWRKLVGVEMETYAVYRACYESPEPQPRMISFKSVCDFAAEKTDSWQAYAAFTAAEYAVGFFRSEWDSLWPKSKET